MGKRIIFFVIGGLLIFQLFVCSKVPKVQNKKLVSYVSSSGGGMTGGHDSTRINIVDGEVILTYSNAKWWYEDANITEYKLDKAVLTDIESVFRKYKMQNWNNKKFSNEFVHDGPSHSYSFRFDDDTSVSFSSQIYPVSYRDKLSEIDKVIEQYEERGTLEPALVTSKKTEEEPINRGRPNNGLIEIEVYEYSSGGIHFRILNGTNKDVAVSDSVKLVRNSDKKVLYNKSSEYPIKIDATSVEENSFLSGRLKEGFYTIYVGDYSAKFEIRLPRDN